MKVLAVLHQQENGVRAYLCVFYEPSSQSQVCEAFTASGESHAWRLFDLTRRRGGGVGTHTLRVREWKVDGVWEGEGKGERVRPLLLCGTTSGDDTWTQHDLSLCLYSLSSSLSLHSSHWPERKAQWALQAGTLLPQRADSSGQMGARLLSHCFIAATLSLIFVCHYWICINIKMARSTRRKESLLGDSVFAVLLLLLLSSFLHDVFCSSGGLQVEQSGGFSSEVLATQAAVFLPCVCLKKTLHFIVWTILFWPWLQRCEAEVVERFGAWCWFVGSPQQEKPSERKPL